jgi:hypothetical protein
MITIISRPVFLCPHRRLSPTNQTTSFETQMIPMTPQVLRRTPRVEVNPVDTRDAGEIERAVAEGRPARST